MVQLNCLKNFWLTKGQDYAHGTGHGIGYFLSIHESIQYTHQQSHVLLLHARLNIL